MPAQDSARGPARRSWAPRGSRPAALPPVVLAGMPGLRQAATGWMTAAGTLRRHIDGTGPSWPGCARCRASAPCTEGARMVSITDRNTALLILTADIPLADPDAAGRRDALLEAAMAMHAAIHSGTQGKLL